MDFEILCGLQERGCTIESIVLCDRSYLPFSEGQSDAFTALQRIADFFSSARVSAFASLDTLQSAAMEAPERYGRATTFVRCDCADIPVNRASALAARLLAVGGHSFALNNEGAGWHHDGRGARTRLPSVLPRRLSELELASVIKRGAMPRSSRTCAVRRRAVPGDRPAKLGPSGEDDEPINGGWTDETAAKLLQTIFVPNTEGLAPLMSARHLAKVLPGRYKVVRVDGRTVANFVPVHGGTAAAPSTRALIVGRRAAESEVLVEPEASGALTVPSRWQLERRELMAETADPKPPAMRQVHATLTKEGVDSKLGIVLERKGLRGSLAVHTVRDGSVTRAAGILPGDVVLKINGEAAPTKPSEATAMLKAATGNVELTVEREEEGENAAHVQAMDELGAGERTAWVRISDHDPGNHTWCESPPTFDCSHASGQAVPGQWICTDAAALGLEGKVLVEVDEDV